MSVCIYLFIILWGIILIPIQYVDVTKSYITCYDGTKYTFLNSDFIHLITGGPFTKSDSEKALQKCRNYREIEYSNFTYQYIILPNQKIINIAYPKNWSESQLNLAVENHLKQLTQETQDKDDAQLSDLVFPITSIEVDSTEADFIIFDKKLAPYTIHWEYFPQGSWPAALNVWIIGLILSFFTLNGLKQSILYIVYGKPFSYGKIGNAIKKLR